MKYSTSRKTKKEETKKKKSPRVVLATEDKGEEFNLNGCSYIKSGKIKERIKYTRNGI